MSTNVNARAATPDAAIEAKPMPKAPGSPARILPGAEWPTVLAAARRAAPEAFDADGGLLNLIGGAWGTPGTPRRVTSPVDGTDLGRLPMLDLAQASRAVTLAADEAAAWGKVDLDERRAKVAACCAELRTHRDLLTKLLVWEIAKPWALAQADVDRCLSGVEWYVAEIGGMVAGRRPLGLVSNIASWNYPLSVLMHAVLVQVLAGNASIAKTPTDGGGCALGVCFAVARRHGLPVSLVSGPGGPLSEALVRHPRIDALSFVGGRSNGRDIALRLVETSKRSMLEMEGINAYGVWEFSDWAGLAAQMRKGFEYGKQRCTAYPRFVVQRRLFPAFLDAYLGVLKGLRFGHPLLVRGDEASAPTLDFGPLINARKAEELRAMRAEAIGAGAVPIYEGTLDPTSVFPGQDVSAYVAPGTLLGVPRSCELYFNEPFGPLDSIVVVDRLEELVAEMNVSNGSLVASVATDDPRIAARLREESRGFKFGHNKVRSRGDKAEVFGGRGLSWKGCFVGGELLVHAVTAGAAGEALFGNFPDSIRLPENP